VFLPLGVLRWVWLYLVTMPLGWTAMLFYFVKRRETPDDAPVALDGHYLWYVPNENHGTLAFILTLAAVFALASIVVPPRAYRFERARISKSPLEGEASRGVPKDALRAYQAPFFLSLVLAATAGLLGFLLGYLGFRLEIAFGILFASLALTLIRFPKKTTIVSLFKKPTK